MLSGTYYAKVQAVDSANSLSALSAESLAAAVVGPTGSINWIWSASTGASSYRLYVGQGAGQEIAYFANANNSFMQTVPVEFGTYSIPSLTNNMFYGEISLPATSVQTTQGLSDYDYIMNLALPPGALILVGLGAAVAAGWVVTVVAGKY